jgi:Ca2+-binding RTX toxin-like protein
VRRRRAIGIGVALLTALPVAQAHATFPGANGDILFGALREAGGSGVWVMSPDGSAQRQLGPELRNTIGLTYSADGSKIAFATSDGSGGAIGIANADGSGRRNLTGGGTFLADAPAFSPDGTKIAFQSLGNDFLGGPAIYVVRVDGGGLIRLGTPQQFGEDPTYSPDGKKIAYKAGGELMLMNADGSAPVPLTANASTDAQPSFSPDGSRIAFSSTRSGSFDIYVMNADGSAQTRLTDDPGRETAPVFSPDGSKIAYNRDPGPQARFTDVYVMSPDGSAKTNLTAGGGGSPFDWAPLISAGRGVLAPGAPGAKPSLCPTRTSPSVRCYRDRRRHLVMAGTSLDERLTGTSGADAILAFGGRDVVSALAGADTVEGGSGNDRLAGGPGEDALSGNTGDDSLSGAQGSDVLRGDAGDDRLSGGAGRDRIACGSGRDRAPGSRGDHVARDCERR